MGGGKTRFAVAETYRLLTFAKAKRVLFLVDRVSLGRPGPRPSSSHLSVLTTGDASATFTASRCCAQATSTGLPASSSALSSACTRCYAAKRSTTPPTSTRSPGLKLPLATRRPVEVSYCGNFPVEYFDLGWSRRVPSIHLRALGSGARLLRRGNRRPDGHAHRRLPSLTSATTSSPSTASRSPSSMASTSTNNSTASAPTLASRRATIERGRVGQGPRQAHARNRPIAKSTTTSSTSPSGSTAPS